MFTNPCDEKLREIRQSARTIAVVGLSDNPEHSSFAVSAQMQKRGYRIIPVNSLCDLVSVFANLFHIGQMREQTVPRQP